MEKKDLLGVRKMPLPPAKRRRKVVAPAKAGAGASARGLAKEIAAYLASDSYMYAPLVSASSPPPLSPSPPASPAPPSAPSEKEVTLVQKYRGSWHATVAAC